MYISLYLMHFICCNTIDKAEACTKHYLEDYRTGAVVCVMSAKNDIDGQKCLRLLQDLKETRPKLAR